LKFLNLGLVLHFLRSVPAIARMPRTKAALTESKSKANSKASAKAEMPKTKAPKKGARGESTKKKKGGTDSTLTRVTRATDFLAIRP
jgi:hypothetical protein